MFEKDEIIEVVYKVKEFIMAEGKEGEIFEDVEYYAKKRLLFSDEQAKKYAENFNKQISDKILNHYNYIRSSSVERIEKYRLTGKSTGIILSFDFKNDEFEKLGIIADTKLIQAYIESTKKSFSEDILVDLLKKLAHSVRLQMLKTKNNNMPIDTIAMFYVETKKNAYTVLIDKIAVYVISDKIKKPIYHDYLLGDFLLKPS